MWPDVKENPLRSLKLKQNPRFGVCQRSTKRQIWLPQSNSAELRASMSCSVLYLSFACLEFGIEQDQSRAEQHVFFVKPGGLLGVQTGLHFCGQR